jgi:tetratricopeptide (TPR) repeat protein
LIEIDISKNDFPKAEAAAQKAIELGDSSTYYHLGVVYFNQQKYAESRLSFEKFLAHQEGHVGALKYLALSHLRLNQIPEAVQVYLKILDVYFNENLLDEAREVRQTILELEPENETVKQYVLEAPSLEVEIPQEQVGSFPLSSDTEGAEAEQQELLAQANNFTERGFYEQAIDVYLDMLKRWSHLPDIRIRLQQVYASGTNAAGIGGTGPLGPGTPAGI